MPEPITDHQVLGSYLAEEQVDGFTVKPWTIKQLLLVMPILDALVAEFKNQGVTWTTWGRCLKVRGWRLPRISSRRSCPGSRSFWLSP